MSGRPWEFGSSPRVRGTRGQGAAERPATPVHPRVCGELSSGANSPRGFHGSSPRVRGTLELVVPRDVLQRFIPACAGNSIPALITIIPTTVHPRVCGELAKAVAAGRAVFGSSPRVRGTRGRESATAAHIRFIPACAGNSAAALRRAHETIGSSPRVRGTREGGGSPSAGRRFIPACAGNSENERLRADVKDGSSPRVRGTRASPLSAPAMAAVHPRVCGELRAPCRRPPRARRFIPACAGNSKARRLRLASDSGSSPRVRGTRHLIGRIHRLPQGSSPRVRGTPHKLGRRWIGIDGSSPRVRGTRNTGRELPETLNGSSPRVRGTLMGAPVSVRSPHGSSPRVRGTLRDRRCHLLPDRFIPACAGNSL